MTRYRNADLDAAKRTLKIDRAELSRSFHLYRSEKLPEMKAYFRANVRNAVMHVRCSMASVARWEAV